MCQFIILKTTTSVALSSVIIRLFLLMYVLLLLLFWLVNIVRVMVIDYHSSSSFLIFSRIEIIRNIEYTRIMNWFYFVRET